MITKTRPFFAHQVPLCAYEKKAFWYKSFQKRVILMIFSPTLSFVAGKQESSTLLGGLALACSLKYYSYCGEALREHQPNAKAHSYCSSHDFDSNLMTAHTMTGGGNDQIYIDKSLNGLRILVQ